MHELKKPPLKPEELKRLGAMSFVAGIINVAISLPDDVQALELADMIVASIESEYGVNFAKV